MSKTPKENLQRIKNERRTLDPKTRVFTYKNEDDKMLIERLERLEESMKKISTRKHETYPSESEMNDDLMTIARKALKYQ